MNTRARALIDALHLQPRPEGGWYRRTFESTAADKEGNRLGSGIYFVLDGREFSAFHRLQGDEVLHHYDGCAVEVVVLSDDGMTTLALGPDVLAGQQPQLPIPAGTLFAMQPVEEEGYALLGCTVSPAFTFDSLSLPSRRTLQLQYPRFAGLIARLTRA